MATNWDWAVAYLEQAKADLHAVETLSVAPAAAKADPSVICMLLQMVFEKAAKGALLKFTKTTAKDLIHSHRAAYTFMVMLKRKPKLLAKVENKNPRRVLSLIAYVRELEEANPSIAWDKKNRVQLRPQLEYPWEDLATGAIHWPAEHLPIANRMRHPGDLTGARLIKLAQKLANL